MKSWCQWAKSRHRSDRVRSGPAPPRAISQAVHLRGRFVSTRNRMAPSGRADQHRMIDLFGRVLEARPNIGWFQEVVVSEDFVRGRATGQHVQHVAYAQAVVANAWAPSGTPPVK